MKKVLITGGSRGLGAELVKVFAENDYIVHYTYCHNNVGFDCEGKQNIHSHHCDMTKDITNMLKDIEDIDIFIGNAAITNTNMLIDMNADEIMDIYNVNLISNINITRHYLSRMNKPEIFYYIGSNQGSCGASCESIYASSKAGLEIFSKSMSLEYNGSDIGFVYDEIAWIDTDMTSQYSDIDKRQYLIDMHCENSLTSAKDIAISIYNNIKK